MTKILERHKAVREAEAIFGLAKSIVWFYCVGNWAYFWVDAGTVLMILVELLLVLCC